MLEDTLIPEGFFAYPSNPPLIAEVIRRATTEINKAQQVKLLPWEELNVSGKLIVDEICRQIERMEIFCADVTGMNPNVMFELGYAISKEKRIWLSIDGSLAESRANFERLKILTTVGIAQCRNSDEMRDHFFKDHPYTELAATVFASAIKPVLDDTLPESLLHIKNRNPTEASNQISKLISGIKLPVIVDDPSETTSQTLSWYGKHVYRALGVVCHLSSVRREGALLHNAKCSLVAGLAYGMGRPLLILSEELGCLAPMDYRDLLKEYRTAQEAVKHVKDWCQPIQEKWEKKKSATSDYISKRKLAQGLKEFHFGEYIAENETKDLLTKYFVETAAYKDALQGRQKIFVGRKGTGKTANFTKLAEELKKNRKALVCVVKPVAYELDSLVSMLGQYAGQEMQGFLIESLWKFLLYSEIALAAYHELAESPRKGCQEFLEFMNNNADLLMTDFSVRLERCVQKLLRDGENPKEISERRARIANALHSGILKELRIHLGGVLQHKDRISILIDNLDKAWEKDRNLNELSHLFLGLLGAAGRAERDFQRDDSRHDALNLSMIIFLRADIFYSIQRIAREPDKINHCKMAWDDKELLFRVIEERFVQSHSDSASPAELWQTYFCPTTLGQATREFIYESILPRPRDLVFFVSSAVTTAINRGHGRVEEDDLLQAKRLYSQHALDSLGVEFHGRTTDFEKIAFEFVGSDSVITESEVRQRLLNAGVNEQAVGDNLGELCLLSFLQIETSPNSFSLVENPQDLQKKMILSRRLGEQLGLPRRFRIHPAFWSFLEISTDNNNGEATIPLPFSVPASQSHKIS